MRKVCLGMDSPSPLPSPSPSPCRIYTKTANQVIQQLTSIKNFGMYWELFQKLVKKCFSGMWYKSIFQMFSDNFYFSESPEIFRNIFRESFQIFCIFSFFTACFSRTFESVKVHELGSWSSYSNIRRSTNPYEEWPSTNQTLILFIQHIIKLIWFNSVHQVCSVLLGTSHLVILIHQSSQIKLIYFMVSLKWLYFNRKKYYNQKKYYKWKKYHISSIKPPPPSPPSI